MLKLKLFLLVFVIFSNCFNAFAQFDVSIKGNFTGAEGKKMRLYEYNDLITFRELRLGSNLIDDNGNFEFNIQIFEPQYIFFRIDHLRTGFFIEPGISYEILFDEFDFEQIDIIRNPYLDPPSLSFSILNSHQLELNKLIDSLETVFDEFLLENFTLANRGRMSPLFARFKAKTDSMFSDVENEYFQSYYEYKFGKYYNIANIKPAIDIASEYFFDRDILYTNLEFMDLFNGYFENFVIRGSRNIRLQDVEFTINDLGSYTALMDSLGKDTILRNEVLRELVLLKTLDRIYHERDFSKRNIDKILNHVIVEGKFPKHRIIAENILFTKNHLKIGSDAPDFKLIDESGKKYTLSDFAGKYLYLSFFTTSCVPCIAELPVKESLYSKYNDFVEFVSVSADRHKTPYSKFLRQNDFSWLFFHFNDNFDILDDYEIRSYPVFILICPEGKIAGYPSVYPSVAIQGYFDFLRRIHQQPDRNVRQRLYYDLN